MLNLVILNYGTGIGNTFIAYPLDLLLLMYFLLRGKHICPVDMDILFLFGAERGRTSRVGITKISII